MLISDLAYSSTLKIEATYQSEESVCLQWITRRYAPEDRTISISYRTYFCHVPSKTKKTKHFYG
jgi:hypothetical protein